MMNLFKLFLKPIDVSALDDMRLHDIMKLTGRLRDGNKIIVNDADVPSAEVLGYYVKESTYYDEQTATFHSRVVAICPILHRSDDFSFDTRKYPMFWVKIEDIEPYLSQRMIMISNLNNA